jgi:hypothetical protein
MPMRCPHCHQEATLEHVRTREDCAQVLRSLAALYRSSRRQTQGAGGRPIEWSRCPRCGDMVSKTAIRRGHGACLPPGLAARARGAA